VKLAPWWIQDRRQENYANDPWSRENREAMGMDSAEAYIWSLEDPDMVKSTLQQECRTSNFQFLGSGRQQLHHSPRAIDFRNQSLNQFAESYPWQGTRRPDKPCQGASIRHNPKEYNAKKLVVGSEFTAFLLCRFCARFKTWIINLFRAIIPSHPKAGVCPWQTRVIELLEYSWQPFQSRAPRCAFSLITIWLAL
jgi:hypothetical protein